MARRSLKQTFIAAAIALAFVPLSPLAGEPAGGERVTVAVAVFDNTTGVAEYDWVGKGFAETMTTKLSALKSLKMVERAQLSEIEKEIRFCQTGMCDADLAAEAGRMVGAEFMVLGSYQILKLGGETKMKVDCRMVNVESSEIEAGKSVSAQGAFEEIFDIQNELAVDMVKRFEVGYTEEEMEFVRAPETDSIAAYEYYTLAREAPEIDEKMRFYERAIELDPDYAFAHLGAAGVYFAMGLGAPYGAGETGADEDTLMDWAVYHAKMALYLRKNLAEAHYVLGAAYRKMGMNAEAAEHYRTYLEMEPDSELHVQRARKHLEEMK
ncbi:MAG: CsgG/HfaB family protein [bacterium]